jgi:hypothetical protein
MRTEGRKITVKHYLNKRAKEKHFQREGFYPLYIQIIVNGKKAQIKSKVCDHLKIYRSDLERLAKNDQELLHLFLSGYLSEAMFNSIFKKKTFPFYHLLTDEVNVLTRIIVFLRPFEDKDFSLNNFSWEYEKHTTEITRILDDSLKELYRAELKATFLKLIDQEDNKDLFKLANYFIHYINWENTFYNFYESTFEIMPSGLKSIENILPNELRTAIKAYLAYHSKVNLLKRFFEKRELGKISTLSFLDWQTDIKDFIMMEFEKLFGEQKALEYIISLDNILNTKIRS